MNRDELLALHASLTSSARELMARKNHDYGGHDVMGNLRLIEQLFPQLTSEIGILIRMGDKLSRLAVLSTEDALVKDESIQDTCQDLINYAVLFIAAHTIRARSKTPPATTGFIRTVHDEAAKALRLEHERRELGEKLQQRFPMAATNITEELKVLSEAEAREAQLQKNIEACKH